MYLLLFNTLVILYFMYNQYSSKLKFEFLIKKFNDAVQIINYKAIELEKLEKKVQQIELEQQNMNKFCKIQNENFILLRQNMKEELYSYIQHIINLNMEDLNTIHIEDIKYLDNRVYMMIEKLLNKKLDETLFNNCFKPIPLKKEKSFRIIEHSKDTISLT